jgi:uncharacterized protein YuzE
VKRIRYDEGSGAFYVYLREIEPGGVEETLALFPDDESELGAYLDIDAEGRPLGLEFLSMAEFEETLRRLGGSLELPERLEDPEAFKTGRVAPTTREPRRAS